MRTGGPIVELAVGSGRIAVPLAAAGYEIVGLDLDPAMLDRAHRRVAAAGPAAVAHLELRQADIRHADPGDAGRYRLAILGLNSLFLLGDRGDQASALATMAALVAPGGLIVVDAWQPQAIDLVRMDGRLSLEWLREDPETRRQVTKLASAWFDPATRTAALTTVFEESRQGEPVIRWTRTDRLRLATPDELVGWAEAAGLEVERLAGDYDLAPFGSGSERAILMATKPR